jgi:SHS2 domain-containing protein
MALYFFDVRDGNRLYPDDQGTEMGGLDEARMEALAALADHVKDIRPTEDRRRVAIEVRNEKSEPLLKAVMIFEVEVLGSS